MSKPQVGKIYESPDSKTTVEVIAVPGGQLYVTAHHEWKQISTVFVKDENIPKKMTSHIDYEKAYKFLTNTEDKDVN